MRERHTTLADLETTIVEPPTGSTMNIIMLHGYSMSPATLSPFAHSLGLAATFYFPLAPQTAIDGGATWWHVDGKKRAESLARGPRDLARTCPDRASVRQQLLAFIREIRQRRPHRTLLGGFSQGGMLSLDALLMEQLEIDALALFSSCLIDEDSWALHTQKLHGLRAFISHGQQDPDLAFEAGLRLRDFLAGAGAEINWVPFDGTHEMPLPVWREFKRFIRELQHSAA